MSLTGRTSDSSRVQVTVIYPFVPHYRVPVFNELLRAKRLEYRIVAGATAQQPSLLLAGEAEIPDLRTIRNRWCGKALFQPAAIAYALRRPSDVTVMLGDVSYVSNWLVAAILRLRRRRVVFWTIGWHRPETGFRRRVRLSYYKLANQLFLYGTVGRQVGLQAGYPAARMWVIGNSLAGPSAPLPAAIATDRAPETVGAVIRPNANKRLDLLLRAVAALRAEGRDVNVLIAGDGPELPALRKTAAALSVPLSTPGAIYEERRLREIYEVLRVTVVPEAVGLTAIQSIAFGTPVITAGDPYKQMPEYEAVKPGVTGDLYAPGDVGELARAIARWLDRTQEIDEDRVARACRAEFESSWTPRAHADRITEGILRMLDAA